MNDQTQAAREDLAFLRAVAEDRGPLPRQLGEHFVVLGLVYGLNVLAAYAGKAGFIPWPAESDAIWGWLPATLLHIPYAIVFSIRTRGYKPGPTIRTFMVAWGAMVLMTGAIVASLFMARAQTGVPYDQVWPAIALALYGGAWTVVSVTRKSLGDFVVALGCFITAVICAALIDRPEKFLALGLGIVLFFAGPGLAIMLRART
jgi:hypothetical protein